MPNMELARAGMQSQSDVRVPKLERVERRERSTGELGWATVAMTREVEGSACGSGGG